MKRLFQMLAKLLLWLALVGFVVVVLQLLRVDLSAPAAWVSNAPWFGLWRLALMLGLVVLWPRLMTVLGQRRGLSEAQMTRLAASRWELACLLLMIELVLVQALPLRLAALLG